MTKKDKLIAGFLVSLGIFSATQAMQYVRTLSSVEKNKIGMTAKNSADRLLTCDSPLAFGTNGGTKSIG